MARVPAPRAQGAARSTGGQEMDIRPPENLKDIEKLMVAAAKNKGVEDVAFHKKCGLAITDMVKSRWVYRRLRNFRAGIEAAISC